MGCSSSKPEPRSPNSRFVGSYHAPYSSHKRRGRSHGMTGGGAVFVGGAACGGGGGGGGGGCGGGGGGGGGGC
ncbi:hypothetical protein AC578_1192 [Pseudocercospora eumusae]|uniref:Uncharacterized protein n=1 Tax=Pseudocercospora eumusae TaxID=321146 RepID=A0A139H053_9PEZI|nr:hypothetical protein AC578_1192 [Pseudocercospora eumusae]KXS95838.1 hypothetical protein AC578_1192 [Pseudocercospora eumusae]